MGKLLLDTRCHALTGRAVRAALALAIAVLTMWPLQASADERHFIQYLGNAEAMVAPDEDIFEGFGTLLPGDKACGVVEISNGSDMAAKMWFWAEGGTAESEALLAEALLEVVDMDSGARVYVGTLHPDGIKDPVFLGEYAPGESAELSWTITLPASLGNEHMASSAPVTWTFAAEDVPASTSGQPRGDGAYAGGVLAQTGDDAIPTALAAAALAALATAGAAAASRRIPR